MKSLSPVRAVILAVVAGGLAACNHTAIQPQAADPMMPMVLPAPQVVVVENFDAMGAQVTLDRGIGPQARRMLGGDSPVADERAVAASVVSAISRTLTGRLQSEGLAVVPAFAPVAGEGRAMLVVGGRMVTIDQGNATRRNTIGLGAGASSVTAEVEIAYVGPAGRTVLERFSAEQKSGRKPGAAETMGISATSAVVGTVVGTQMSSVEHDASDLAKTVASKVQALWKARGWGMVRN